MTSVRTLGRTATDSATGTVSLASICVLAVVSILSGVWAFACLFGALVTVGAGELYGGFLAAVGF